jgi:hypothetical protein
VTEPGDVLLGRAEIERAFTALGERLARRGVVADAFVAGRLADLALQTSEINPLSARPIPSLT